MHFVTQSRPVVDNPTDQFLVLMHFVARRCLVLKNSHDKSLALLHFVVTVLNKPIDSTHPDMKTQRRPDMKTQRRSDLKMPISVSSALVHLVGWGCWPIQFNMSVSILSQEGIPT